MRSIVIIGFMISLTRCLPVYDDNNKNEYSRYSNPELNGGFFEGDIIISPEQLNAVQNKTYYWPNAVVPIELANNLTSIEIYQCALAMTHISSKTCIKFVKKTNAHKDYVFINKNKENFCASPLGKRGGRQVIQLGEYCFYMGTIAHELLHALAFVHEHSRWDRDEYVDIIIQNINETAISNFLKFSNKFIDSFGISYDYGSVMHYARDAFSINGGDTIRPKDSTAVIGQRDGLSEKDFLKINKLYKCEKYL